MLRRQTPSASIENLEAKLSGFEKGHDVVRWLLEIGLAKNVEHGFSRVAAQKLHGNEAGSTGGASAEILDARVDNLSNVFQDHQRAALRGPTYRRHLANAARRINNMPAEARPLALSGRVVCPMSSWMFRRNPSKLVSHSYNNPSL